MGPTSTAGTARPLVAVVVNPGARGRVGVTRGAEIDGPPFAPRVVGGVQERWDAYRAGFYAGLARGYDLRRCGILASAVASFVVEEKGTQTNLPRWAQTVARARRHASF